jgi:hypothetical protein
MSHTPGQVFLVLGFVAFWWFYFLVDSGMWNSNQWFAIGIGAGIGLLTGLSSIKRKD